MKRSSDNEWGNYSRVHKIAYGKIPALCNPIGIFREFERCSRTRRRRFVMWFDVFAYHVNARSAPGQRDRFSFSSPSSRSPFRPNPRRPVVGHWFARNIIRKHQKQMSVLSDWNERRLNKSKDRKCTLKRKKKKKRRWWEVWGGRGRKGMTMGSRGLVSSQGLAFIKSTKAPRGMVFRCEYYICYRKLSVVLVLPPTLSPQTTISRYLFLSFVPFHLAHLS